MPVQTVYVDVDFTLIDKDNKLYLGVKEALNYMRNTLGYTMICWSHGGGKHAKDVCKKHELTDYFDLFLDKPDIIIDDDPDFIMKYPKVMKVTPLWGNSFMKDLFNKSKKRGK